MSIATETEVQDGNGSGTLVPPHVFSSDVPGPEVRTEPAARPEPPPPAPVPLAPIAQQRLVSLDAYRGLTMVLMVSAGLQIGKVVSTFEKTPELRHLKTPLWERLAYQTDHAPWVGCSLWDLIQPS